jgi:uncharacterized damage-inducible protein DinB
MGNQEEVLSRYREGTLHLEQAVRGLSDMELDTAPTGGGWTIRQIVHHLVDGDVLWTTCIKAALGNPEGEFSLQWYGTHSQDVWAQRWEYAQRAIGPSLDLLKATRSQVLELLGRVPDAWERTINVRLPSGDLEVVSVGTIVEMQSEHVPHHMKRIREILGEK